MALICPPAVEYTALEYIDSSSAPAARTTDVLVQPSLVAAFQQQLSLVYM
jgi:hypothetical protein